MCFEREDEREEGKEQREVGREVERGNILRTIAQVGVVILAWICVWFYQSCSLSVVCCERARCL